jgi:hypothetical protein
VNVEAELTTAEDGDACVLCESPIDDGDVVVAVSTSLTPDEVVVVCRRCARVVGEAARV